MSAEPPSKNRSLLHYFLPFLIAFTLVKIVQFFLYPDPYLIADTGEYLHSARTLATNPYKPIGYSLFIALGRLILPFPIGVAVLQSILKLCTTLMLGMILRRFYSFPRWAVLALCTLIGLEPTAVLLDHYLLSDSVFISCTVGLIAACLAYARNPAWRWFLLASGFTLVCILLRFVGVVYSGLLLATILVYGGKQKYFRAILVPSLVAMTVLAISARTNRDLGVFKFTTFDGWALYGSIAHMLKFDDKDVERMDDPEARLVYHYLLSFPDYIYESRARDFFRWAAASPAKNLLNTFLPISERPEHARAVRDSTFLTWFMKISDPPKTPAQKLFQKYRNKDDPNLPPYIMNYHQAFIVTNELLRTVNREYMKRHWKTYLSKFYVRSFARLFLPIDPIMRGGQYTYRDKPDRDVSRLWPGTLSSEWKPRFGDVAARIGRGYTRFVTVMWLLAMSAFVYSLYARKRDRLSWWKYISGTGVLLLAFAIAYGAVIGTTHILQVRYTSSIMPFVIVSMFYLRLHPGAPWRE